MTEDHAEIPCSIDRESTATGIAIVFEEEAVVIQCGCRAHKPNY